jgi:hypothetical protein
LNLFNGSSNVAWNLDIHPFTVGIELNTAIAYYDAQVAESQTPDARVPIQVRAVLDWLWNFWNLNAGNNAFAYQFWDIPKLATFNQSKFTELNDTVAPAYAWMWAICGNSCTLPDGVTTYQQAADAIFQHEFDNPSHFITAKQFNQAYEMSFDDIYLRNGSYHYYDMTILGSKNPNLGPYPDTALPYNATLTTTGLAIMENAPPVCVGGSGSMTITWNTFEHTTPSLTQIKYGLSSTMPSNTVTGTDTETQLITTDNQWQHVATASGIAPGTYYYAVATTDDAGNVAQSSYNATFPSQFTCMVH